MSQNKPMPDDLEKYLDKWFTRFMRDKVVRTDIHATVCFYDLKSFVLQREQRLKEEWRKEMVGKIEKGLHDFRVNCKRLEEIHSPIQILDTSKNFFIQKIIPLLIAK